MNTLKTARPFWVYYQDIDTGSNVQLPQLIRGYENDNYTIRKREFPRYKLMKTDGKLTGSFDGTQKDVHFFYRKKSWGEIEHVDMFIHLDSPVQEYDTVDGMPISKLPGGIYVRSFERIATTTGEFWYEVNAYHWIKFDVNTMQVSKKDPFAHEAPTKNNPITDLRVLPLNKVKATVDYLKGGHLYTYEHPYGEPSGTVANGQDLVLIGRLEDKNGVTWYQDEKRGFINGAYVRLENEDE